MIRKLRLPKKPSVLLRLALNDLCKVEKDKRYCINMGHWHTYDPGQACQVCLAGSILACKIRKPTLSIDFNEVHPVNKKALAALDDFRAGFVNSALATLGYNPQDYPDIPIDFPVCDYDINPSLFKRTLRKLATRLKKAGL